jgi:hypothetical protein
MALTSDITVHRGKGREQRKKFSSLQKHYDFEDEVHDQLLTTHNDNLPLQTSFSKHINSNHGRSSSFAGIITRSCYLSGSSIFFSFCRTTTITS